jgi:hypothetical protein
MLAGTAAVAREARARERRGEPHAGAVREALPERSRSRLDAGRVAVLRMTGRARAELAELAQVVEREVVAEEVQQRVEQHRRVAVREDEPIAQQPGGIRRIEAQVVMPQLEGRRGESHRRARMPALRALDGVDGQEADRVDDAFMQGGARLGHYRLRRDRCGVDALSGNASNLHAALRVGKRGG